MQSPEQLTDAGTVGGTSATVLLWGLSVDEFAVLSAAAIAIVSGLVSVYIRLRADHRAAQRHKAEMERLHGDDGTEDNE